MAEKVTITYGQFDELSKNERFSSLIQEKDFNGSDGMLLGRLIVKLNKEMEFYYTKRNEIIQKSGGTQEENGMVLIKDKEAVDEIIKLSSTKIPTQEEKVSVLTENLPKLTIQESILLEPFMEVTVSSKKEE